MNRYYVSARRGSDSTGDGSAANPWKTIDKAIGSSPAVSLGTSGAIVYIEPGTYYGSVTLGLSPTAATPLEIVGDCDGAGFLAGGHPTPATGVVDWSAWVDDATPASATCLRAIGKSNVTLRRLKMIGGKPSDAYTGACLYVSTGCASWTLTDSTFVALSGGSVSVALGGPSSTGLNAGANMTVKRCLFMTHALARPLRVTVTETATEYSLDSTIRDCVFLGGHSVVVERAANTGLGKLGSGLTFAHCAFLCCGPVEVYKGLAITLANPNLVRGCLLTTGLVGGNASHVSEDWNVINADTPRTSVAPGARSVAQLRPAIDVLDGRLVGTPLRILGTPTPGSPLLGFVAGSGFSAATDLTGRARPEGGLSTNPSPGALELHDTGEPNVVHADAGSGACLALRGPASLERPVLVDAGPTTISVKVRWDGNHGDAAKPRAILLANPEIGVTDDQILTATSDGGLGSAPNAYETLTFATFTPTRAGALMLRLVSRAASGNGVAYFDSITLT